MRWTAGVAWISDRVRAPLPPGPAPRSADRGVIAGVGSVVVFLPQIVILFFFILAMEASGYMARAAFLMDRLMAACRAFGPQLHSAAVQLCLRHSGDHGDPHHRRSARTG